MSEEASAKKPFAQRLDERADEALEKAKPGDVVLADAIVIHARAIAELTEVLKTLTPKD